MTEVELKKVLAEALEQNNAVLFGQLARYVDAQIGGLRSEMHERFDGVATSIDALSERVVTDEVERLAMGAQQDRHERWIRQLAESTGTKLASAEE